jgi:hypothetical protein
MRDRTTAATETTETPVRMGAMIPAFPSTTAAPPKPAADAGQVRMGAMTPSFPA